MILKLAPRTAQARDNRAHGDENRYRVGHPPGVLLQCFGLEPVHRYQSILAHGLDGPRRLFQRPHPRNCLDSGWLPLAGHGARLASLRRRACRSVAAAGRRATPGNFISDLLVAHDGTLWIGTLSGLASWRNSTFTHYREVAGAEVASLLEDRQQTIWIGTSEASKKGRLCAIRGGKIEC